MSDNDDERLRWFSLHEQIKREITSLERNIELEEAKVRDLTRSRGSAARRCFDTEERLDELPESTTPAQRRSVQHTLADQVAAVGKIDDDIAATTRKVKRLGDELKEKREGLAIAKEQWRGNAKTERPTSSPPSIPVAGANEDVRDTVSRAAAALGGAA